MKKSRVLIIFALFALALFFTGCQFFPEYAKGNIHGRPSTNSGDTGNGTSVGDTPCVCAVREF